MELVVKHFSELENDELLEIFKLRVSIFVVEQNCPYQEIDDADKAAYHVYLKDKNGIQAYLRVLSKNIAFEEALIGRVIAVKRRCGLGSRILNEGIRVAKENFKAKVIMVEAQTYAKTFYEKGGFVQCSDEFSEYGVPRVKMRLTL